MITARPADWQLPEGVDRGLWDYVNDPALARAYDAGLAGSSLFASDLDFLLRHCPAPGRLLDLGCGTGRALAAAARTGLRVVGVDLSAEMLRVARGKTEGLPIELLRANLVDLRGLREGSFDYAACLFSTLGMLVGAEARERAVRQAHRVLKPGGKFVLHVHNRWFNLRTPVGRRWVVGNWLRSLLGSEPAGDRVMPPHQGVGNLTLHLFTRREATRLLRRCGFQVVEVRPLSLRPDGQLPCPWLFGRLRAYGYLIAAHRS